MRARTPLIAIAVAALAAGAPPVSRGDESADTLVRTSSPERYQVSVSATKLPRRTEEVANALTVVSGDELRRRGTRTLAEALQDVSGLDTGEGSDNGPTLPNLGLWGLKEFDALLVTLDGVPVGGPFNPSLSQIPVSDIDRIEVVKGPQGTLYGISAFAGMVQVFTRSSETGLAHATVGGGSFSNKHAQASVSHRLSDGTSLLLSGATQRSDGWQDRTGTPRRRGAAAGRARAARGGAPAAGTSPSVERFVGDAPRQDGVTGLVIRLPGP